MNNILIYYFSGTGNTKKIAGEYTAALRENDCDVTVREVTRREQVVTDDTAEFDRIGIGYPIHAFNAPEIIVELCKSFPKREKTQPKQPVFIFKTSGEPVRMSDASSLKTVKLLEKRGYEITNEYQYVMPYNLIFRHTDEQAYKMWETAKRLVKVDVAEILRGEVNVRYTHRPALGGACAALLRIEYGGARIIGRGFKTNKNCIDCGLCVKTCPAGNITVNKKGKIKFGGHCMICMRCAFKCPKDAIVPGLLKGWKVNGEYSFTLPEQPSPPTKHDNYCKKAYDRYYADAEKRINDFDKE